MDETELKAILAELQRRLTLARQLIGPATEAPAAHYARLLADIEVSLPTIARLYHANRDALPRGPLTRSRRRLRLRMRRLSMGAFDGDLHRLVHELRHDHLEIIHPLEVLGKWPPDPPPGATSGAPPKTRGLGKWPPDPV